MHTRMKQGNQQEKHIFPGLSREYRESPSIFPGSVPREFFETPGSSLASFETVAAMADVGTVLMLASPRAPLEKIKGGLLGRGKSKRANRWRASATESGHRSVSVGMTASDGLGSTGSDGSGLTVSDGSGEVS